jgi:hypothetical protein
MDELRSEVNSLIDKGRVRVHPHARSSHPELSSIEHIAIVRYGGRPKPDRNRPLTDGVYVCWATLPSGMRARAVFFLEGQLPGDIAVVITSFEE